MTTTHYLKTVNPYFNAVWMKLKTFELRKNNRNFKVGDTVVLMEYDNVGKTFTANQVIVVITYILHKFNDALNEEYVIFSFKEVGRNFNLSNTTI